MDLICRICQQSEVEELIHISCIVAGTSHRKRICDMINAVTGLSVEEYDRLPQHVCGGCAGRLDRTYRLWNLCQGAVSVEVLHQKVQNKHMCHICCNFIDGEACKEWDADIGNMFQQIGGALIHIDDGSYSWFVCKRCLSEMKTACEVKSKCIESEASLLKKRSFVWERMEVDACNEKHLVIELYAEAVQEQDGIGNVHCSVCLLELEIKQLDKKCAGCKLDFRNYDKIRSVDASSQAEESNRISPVEIDSVWLEENTSQEFIDDEREEKCLSEDDAMCDTNTGMDNYNHTEITSSAKKCLVYIGKSRTQYEIFEKYPDDPFPKARRTGPFCCKCMIFFDTEYQLETHTKKRHRTPTGKGDISCDVCLSLFTDQQSLEVHKAKLQTFFYDFCKFCQIVLFSPYLLMQHKKLSHQELEKTESIRISNESASVDENNTRIQQIQGYNPKEVGTKHFPEDSAQIEIMTDTLFTCCGCKELFATDAELVEHVRKKHPPPSTSSSKPIPRAPKCPDCHKFFDNAKDLERHTTVNESKITYRCKLASCDFRTKDIEQIRRHILGGRHQDVLRTMARNANPSEYVCCVLPCEFRSNDYDTMIKHGKMMHVYNRDHIAPPQSELKFKCPVCGKGFLREIALINHKNGRQTYHCRGCGMIVPREARLSHRRCMKSLRVKCEFCDKLMESEGGLRLHIKAVHWNQSKEHLCSVCGKHFKNLTVHMQSHVNDKQRVCNVCGARFFNMSLLIRHRRVHMNEAIYACRHGCEKRYRALCDRDRHERLTHLGITPFRCEVCKCSFLRLASLRMHQKKDHPGLKLKPSSVEQSSGA